ncbi:hypothetical protein D3C72_1657240 [compost metagenome]
MLVPIALPHEAGVQVGDEARLFVAGLGVAFMFHGHVADAAGAQQRGRVPVQHQPLAARGLRSQQPAVIDGFGNETADGGMHAVRRVQEDAAISGDGGLAVQQVFQRGLAGPARVRALGRLPELHLVAQQHDVACA